MYLVTLCVYLRSNQTLWEVFVIALCKVFTLSLLCLLTVLQTRGSMWKTATVIAVFAITLGYFYHTHPNLPDQLYSSLQFSNDYHTLNSEEVNLNTPTFEHAIATAWEAIITVPVHQWKRIAVG